ncbi:hypothetical protein [Pontibaca methylaminivorans]|uniref:Uncharacterized protein n=1 Tax=Pontibaca methylaminivorans TaxID=515897 RepID=A0A1R3W9T7_9RHOB|nr:hypothetical protein [Pontibaca methylaminivorans]SIT74561.1 hypothetical protein SAMN05421849_0178 [Pontibaca methylaminivorans]
MTDRIDTAKERGKLAALEGHTPGPWQVRDCDSVGHRCTNYYQEIWSENFDVLVTTEVTRAHGDGGRENIRLIAGAPDLKATLAAALDALNAARMEIERLRVLLARNLVFDTGSAEDGLDALGGWDEIYKLLDVRAALNPEANHD